MSWWWPWGCWWVVTATWVMGGGWRWWFSVLGEFDAVAAVLSGGVDAAEAFDVAVVSRRRAVAAAGYVAVVEGVGQGSVGGEAGRLR